jgi:hypothetical protein
VAKKNLLDEAKAEKPDAEIRHLRKLERQLAEAKAHAAGVTARYHATLNDLAVVESELELFKATRGVFTEREFNKRIHKHDKSATATVVIVATDWHAEERVDPQTINHENEFNLTIAEKRVRQLWDKALLLTEASRKLSNIDECVLAILGDLMGGHIHEELAESNFLSPVEAVRWIQQQVHDGLQYLRKHGGFKRIRVPCCSGNHGRDTKKTRIATREKHSYEWLAYQNVADYFRSDPKVKFQIADGILNYVDVEGWLVRFTHGDSIKFGGGVGGLTVPANKKIHKWDQTQKAYLTVFGHFHQHLRQNNFICCPTLKGYDAFSEWIGAAKEEPAQLFCVMDSKRGLVEEKKIFVEAA